MLSLLSHNNDKCQKKAFCCLLMSHYITCGHHLKKMSALHTASIVPPAENSHKCLIQEGILKSATSSDSGALQIVDILTVTRLCSWFELGNVLADFSMDSDIAEKKHLRITEGSDSWLILTRQTQERSLHALSLWHEQS